MTHSPPNRGFKAEFQQFTRQVSDYTKQQLTHKLGNLSGGWWILGALGLDVVDTGISLIPVVGDTLGAMAPASLLVMGYAKKLPLPYLAVMTAVVFLDWSMGMMPVAGDVADALTPATLINALLLKAGLAAQEAETAQAPADNFTAEDRSSPKAAQGKVPEHVDQVIDVEAS